MGGSRLLGLGSQSDCSPNPILFPFDLFLLCVPLFILLFSTLLHLPRPHVQKPALSPHPRIKTISKKSGALIFPKPIRPLCVTTFSCAITLRATLKSPTILHSRFHAFSLIFHLATSPTPISPRFSADFARSRRDAFSHIFPRFAPPSRALNLVHLSFASRPLSISACPGPSAAKRWRSTSTFPTLKRSEALALIYPRASFHHS